MTGLHVAVVDWSAAAKRSPARASADAIWIGICDETGEKTRYCRSRAEAETLLRDLIRTGTWLIGFDFPMGYPAGFARRLTGQTNPRAIWDWLEARITDSPTNANNRFAIAAAINRQFGGGPFWGRPAGLDLPDLPARKTVDYGALDLPERRQIETLIRSAQPVWKLYTTGSVGSQALMGLPVIARLARLPDVAVWPFDPPARVTLAEVYPSLLAAEVAAEPGIKDQVQVRLLARALWRLHRQGALAPLLTVPEVAQAEGWILGAGHVPALRAALSCA